MKKLIGLLVLTICLIVFGTNLVLAEEYGNFTYKTIGDEVIITGVKDKTVTELNIPDEIDGKKVTAIGDYAFKDLKKLAIVNISDTVKNIGENTFYRCESLEKVTLPSELTKIPDGMFYQCSALGNIDIPETVAEIGEYAFRECTILKQINLHEGVKKIGEYAFFGCKGLTAVTLPSTLTVIEASLFCDCSGLKDINILGNVIEIEEMAFAACISLERIDLPNSVERICEGAFFNCILLNNFVFPENIKFIDTRAFSQCNAFAEITIYGNDVFVAEDVFSECSNLKKIIIGDGVTLADNCFSGLGNLEKVYITGTAQSIGQGAFSFCENLIEAYILSDVITTMPVACFYDCHKLQKVIISDKIQTIEEGAFLGCSNLKRVLYGGTAEQWKNVTVEGYNPCLTEDVVRFEKNDIEGILSLDKINAVLNIGSKLILKCSAVPFDITNEDVIWSSSSENVASVTDGVVTAVSDGDVTITAKTKNGYYIASCYIIVSGNGVQKPIVTPISAVYEKPYTDTDENGEEKTFPSGVAFATVYDKYGNYELKEFGMLLTDKNLGKDEFTLSKKGVIKGKGEEEPNAQGKFGIMFYGNGLQYGKTYYTISYAIYEDESGNEITIYGDKITEFSPKGE